MRFRAIALPFVILLLLAVTSCAENSVPVDPTVPGITGIDSSRTTSTMQPGHNLLGYYEITINTDTETVGWIPIRAADIHLNVLQFLEFGPCFDCLAITNFQTLPNKDIQFDIVLTHPFPLPHLSGFDVRGIAMFGGDFDFENLGVTASSILEDNPELINADGHTTLYQPATVGNGLQGYLKGLMAPDFAAPNATINAFKTFYTNTNRRYFLAGEEATANYLISSPLTVFTFGYAVDASWDQPTEPVSVPDSFPIEANSPEAYLIETELDAPLALTGGSTAIITIDIYDWQGASTIDAVSLEGPRFWDGLIEAAEDTGGPGDKRFTAELVNEFGFVDQGDYPVLIRVTDTTSVPEALVDNIAWRIIQVPVILNHAPTCMAEVSTFEPDPDEIITFTDTSTDPEGPGDIAESWWDWDNDGNYDEEGDEVTHSWSVPGVYKVNHKVIDTVGAWDELDDTLNIDVGLFITLQEDYDAKPPGRTYRYKSLDGTYDSGAIIDVDDTDGPWDFTTIGLVLGANKMSIIDDADSEVSAFVDDFNAATTHFVKFENMFDPFFPLLYQAEYHQTISEKLYIYGFHDPWVIGSSPFGPPDTVESLAVQYPLTVDTDVVFDINEPGFILNYTVRAVGEGDVTVPYDGGTTYHCLMMMYRFSVSSAEPVNGATLNFAFITDSGIVVANVIAVNDPPDYNWNTSTNKIDSNGDVLFQALNTYDDE